jgi:CII-binding regulator of phage lambda lysogenization HflD
VPQKRERASRGKDCLGEDVMSTEINKKDAAAVSAAIAAYLAKSTATQDAVSGEAIAQLQRSLELLLERMESLEKKMDMLAASVNDVSRRVEEMGKK